MAETFNSWDGRCLTIHAHCHRIETMNPWLLTNISTPQLYPLLNGPIMPPASGIQKKGSVFNFVLFSGEKSVHGNNLEKQ